MSVIEIWYTVSIVIVWCAIAMNVGLLIWGCYRNWRLTKTMDACQRLEQNLLELIMLENKILSELSEEQENELHG